MKEIHVKIEGVTPLLMNRFTDEAQKGATEGTRPAGPRNTMTPHEDAESRLYKEEGGKIIVPQPNVLRCLTDAGKFFKAGKSKVTTQKSSLIPAAVMMRAIFFPLVTKKAWTLDARPVCNPSTGGRFTRFRPAFYDWGLSFDMELDDSVIPLKLMREITDAAGSRIGLMDFRPDRKGPFGRFVVVEWKSK